MAIFYQDLLKFDEMAAPAEPSTPTVAHPILDRSRDVVMMTADEPMFPDPKAPKHSTHDLAEELKRNGVEFELTKGKYNNKPETSVIAYDMPSELAHQLAKKYMQESYVHIEPNGTAKLKYANGAERDNPNDESQPPIPLEGKFRDEVGTPKVSDSEPENNFTYIPSINKYVSLDFDWGKLPSELPSFKGEPTMKNEFTIDEVKAEIAKVLKKYQDEYESTLIELRKADKGHKGQLPHNATEERKIKHIAASYEKEGKSPEQSKAIAYATVNAEHKKAELCDKCGKSECVCKSSCKKCGSVMTKADMCAKCGELSAVRETQKNEAVSIMEKKGDKSAKGPQETPDKTKEVEASGSGGDIKRGKLGKAEEDLKMLMQIEELEKAGFLGKLGAAAGLAAALGGAPKTAEAAPRQTESQQSARNESRANFIKLLAGGGQSHAANSYLNDKLKTMGFHEPEKFWSAVANSSNHTLMHYLAVEPEVQYEQGNWVKDVDHLRHKFVDTFDKKRKEMPESFNDWAGKAGLAINKPMGSLEAAGIKTAPSYEEEPRGGFAGQRRRESLGRADAKMAQLESMLHPAKKNEEDLKTLLGLELLFKASEESSEETSSPERGSHEETPADEESKTKKSVHNIKAESSFSSEKSLAPRTAGNKAPEHSASASPKLQQPSRLGKLIGAAKHAIGQAAPSAGAGRAAAAGIVPYSHTHISKK